MLNFQAYTAEQLVKDRQDEIRRNVEAVRAGMLQSELSNGWNWVERIQALFDDAADAAVEAATDLRDTVELVCVSIAQEESGLQPATAAPSPARSTQEIKRRMLAERIASHHAINDAEERAAQRWQ